ncbi:MAG: adenosylhomocysteinase, partial [Pseudomonadales bacterium]
CDANMLKAVGKNAIICNIGHFDTEIDTSFMRDNWQWEEVKPQVHKIYRSDDRADYILLLSEGRLVNLGNATGHPSRIMDGSFANQVLAQMYLYERAWANHDPKQRQKVTVEVLPKSLDEEVAAYMVQGFGGQVTRLTSAQADYIKVPEAGPFKPEGYKY